MDMNDNTNHKRVVFSGIQPTGNIHLGNYLGAVRQWVARQDEKVNYFCIVDLHSLTVPQDPDELRFQTRSLAAILMAAGLDPDAQHHLHPEPRDGPRRSCWLLNCITPSAGCSA
jgi:tryptophanyl-tRNA synthetase